MNPKTIEYKRDKEREVGRDKEREGEERYIEGKGCREGWWGKGTHKGNIFSVRKY